MQTRLSEWKNVAAKGYELGNHTLYHPCIGDSSFINAMKSDFVTARAVRNEIHKINEVDLYNTDCYVVNNTDLIYKLAQYFSIGIYQTLPHKAIRNFSQHTLA